MIAYLVFFAMHLTLLLASIGTNTVSVAFSSITTDLHASLVTAGWVLSIYLLVFTVSTVLMGKISDRFGRKQTFVACNILFVAGSLVAALSPNIWVLILGRFVQSVGGGGLVPTTLGVITEMFPTTRQRMVGLSISVFNIGGIIGPGIGAWLVSSYGWRSVFWFNVPVGIVALIPVIILLKPDKPKPSHIDIPGALLLAVSLFGLMIGVSRIGTHDSLLEWLTVVVLVLAGVICFYLFLRRSHKSPDPVVEPQLLGKQPFLATNLFNFIYGACVFSCSSFIPLFITSAYGLSTYQSGLILSIRAVGNIIAAVGASFLITRWSYRQQIMFGTILVSITTILMAVQPHSFHIGSLFMSDFTILALINFVSGLALGAIAPAMINCLVDIMPQKTAIIAGLGSMFRQSGGAIFIAIMTVILQSNSSTHYGFMVSFLLVGILVTGCVPFILKMPNRPTSTVISPKD
jgi:EmrB/QacA subfamily drug resistance transporter